MSEEKHPGDMHHTWSHAFSSLADCSTNVIEPSDGQPFSMVNGQTATLWPLFCLRVAESAQVVRRKFMALSKGSQSESKLWAAPARSTLPE